MGEVGTVRGFGGLQSSLGRVQDLRVGHGVCLLGRTLLVVGWEGGRLCSVFIVFEIACFMHEL